ncbi:unnamed protein product [Effrenium voratum]|uniref:Uncharacterized protein n=1 Tax=Effrenium voratum TaxID=2562239 RepID=A0AA36HVT6_9DINO|nr:unnamed protein product [Effrenium voratum]
MARSKVKVQDAHDVLKRVLLKHHRQRETRKYHEKAADNAAEAQKAPEGEKAALLQRQGEKSEQRSLDSSVSSKIPFVSEVTKAVNTAVETVDGTGLTGDSLKDAFNQVKDQGSAVEFIQNTVIDTVEKATTILLNYRGFQFSQSCRVDSPSVELLGQTLRIHFGGQYCSITLVGQTVTLFNVNHGHRDVHFPSPLDWLPSSVRTLAGASSEIVQHLLGMSYGLLNTHHCTRADAFHCMAKRVSSFVMQFEPPLNWMPASVKTLAGASSEIVQHLLGMSYGLLNTHHCTRADAFHCMAKRVSSFVMQFEPPLNWMPASVKTLAGASSEIVQHLLGMSYGLLNTHHCTRADAFHCMAKRVSSFVMQFEPPLNWLPQQVKSIASTPMNAVTTWLTMGNDLMDCANIHSSVELTKCLGLKIISAVPPLNFLGRMKEVLTETIMTFARVATQVVKKALQGSASLLQKASTSKFPAVGERMVHHKDKNLLIESHSQHLDASLLQRKPSGAVGYKFNAGRDVHASPLVTQFKGREVDTGSCLAFAPRGKNGAHVANHQEATKTDWTAPSKENFIQLEPWAVPCDNAWMKDNWNKWQGYSFYTATLPIEKCLTITFSMGMQPVVAFVGGLEFELLPKPLVELATTVCWPNKMPGGLDLSILRSEIKSAGNLVFSRTLRLAKRFGQGTDFVKANVESSYQTWKHVAGLPGSEGESRSAFDKMSLMESNRSNGTSESLHWKTDVEDLYVASVNYNEELTVNTTSELRGADAARRMSAIQEAKEDIMELFNFQKEGMTNFKIQGLLAGNSLEMGIEMGFGEFKSPAQRIPLINIVDQFSVILASLRFISLESKEKAIAALQDFSTQDAGRANGVPLRPGSVIALHNKAWNRYLSLADWTLYPSPPENENGIRAWWTHQRFTVVDAGNGQIALHNTINNRFVGTGSVSPVRNINDLPGDWASERFTVVDVGNGEIALQGLGKQFLQLTDQKIWHTAPMDHLPPTYVSERFKVVPGERKLVPGSVIALYNTHWKKFLTMNRDHVSTSPEVLEIGEGWTYERFTVVEVNSWQVALHNPRHNRFISLSTSMASSHCNVDQFNQAWESAKWDAWPAVDGQIGLHNAQHNRFANLQGGGAGASGHPPGGPWDSLPWLSERLRIVHLKPFLEPGSVVALHNAYHRRFVNLHPHDMHFSEEKDANFDMPDGWTFERFTVVDAGNGQIALHNALHNRYVKMGPNGDMTVSPVRNLHDPFPHDWFSERFTVLSAHDIFDGVIGLHNSAHGRMLRMTALGVDSHPVAAQDFTSGFFQESFRIVLVGAGNQGSLPVGLEHGGFSFK